MRIWTRFTGGLCLLVALTACATPALWEATDSKSYVLVPPGRLNTNELARLKIDYIADPKTGELFVPQSQMRKVGNYTVRILATPVTVALDLAGVAVMIVVGAFMEDWEHNVRENPSHPDPLIVYPMREERERRAFHDLNEP